MTEEKILAVRVQMTGISDETRQVAELNDELSRLAERRREINTEIKKNGQATKEEKEELLKNEQSTRDLSEAKGNLIRTEKLASKEFKAAAGSMNELRAKTSALRNEANNLNLTTDAGKRKFKELNQQILANTNQIRNYDRGISGSSTLVGEYGRGIMNAFTKVGIAVAAAWGIIKAGEKVINSAQGASDKWEKTIGGLRNGLDQLFKTLATGDFSGFLKGINDAIKSGREYTEVMDDLKDRQRQFNITESDAQEGIEKNKQLMRSAGELKDVRLKAAEDIEVKEEELALKNKENMKIAYEIALKEAADHTKWSQEELMFYIKNYDQLVADIEIGKEYIQLQKDIESAIFNAGKTGAGASEEQLKREKELVEQGGAYWERYVQNRDKTNDKELDSVAQKYIAMNAAGVEYYKKTTRVDALLHRLEEDIRKEEEKSIKDLNDAQKKAHDDYIKQLQDEAAALKLLLEVEKTRYDMMMLWQAAQESKFMKEVRKKSYDKKGEWKIAVPEVSEISEMPGENPRFTQAQWEEGRLFNIKQEAYAAQLKALKESLRNGEITEGEYLARRNQAYQISFKGTTQDVIAGLGNMADAFGEFGEKSKVLTLIKIGLDTASAISSLVAMSEANPTNAVTFGAAGMIQFATGLIRIFANIMTARKVIMGKGKYTGGEIGADDGIMLTKPTPHGDNMLIVAKKGEVVLNEHQQGYFGKEAFRSAGVPGFAGGGMIGSAGINYAPSGSMDINRLAGLMASKFNDKKIFLEMNELRDTSKKYAEIRSTESL